MYCFGNLAKRYHTIPNHLICPNGYSIIRKDRRERIGGGIAIICRHDWQLSGLGSSFHNTFECLWVKVQTPNSAYYIAALYNPPDTDQRTSLDLIDHLMDSCELLQSADPNAKIIIGGDINQLDIKPLLNQLCLKQMVKSPKRGQHILDVFITNAPHLWAKVSIQKCLVRSDHSSVLVLPRVPCKAIRRTVEFRDVREHNKIAMARSLENCNWDEVTSIEDPVQKVQLLQDKLVNLFNTNFPCKRIRMSSRDPPYMSPLVKTLLKILKRNLSKNNRETNPYLQERINTLIRTNQSRGVKEASQQHSRATKKWWDTVNSISGRNSTSAPILDPHDINHYFQSINTDPNYSAPIQVQIPEGTRIPVIPEHIVQKFLLNLKRTSSGPDELPFWLWRDFAYDLAPIITSVFNSSLKYLTVPLLWKMANISPIPKETPLDQSNQLRPISVTNVIMRLFEKIVYQSELHHLNVEFIGNDQYAYKKGLNSTMALLKCQYKWLQWLDSDAYCVRIFSFDFSKAFDTVPHDILCNKLKQLNINPYIYNCIISFLSSRKQRVKVDGMLTEFVDINRGVPQGTILGPILFSVMVNDIKVINPTCSLLEKFADDLTLNVPIRNNGSDGSSLEVSNIMK